MHQEGHIESGSGYSSGPTGGRTTNTSTNRTPFGSAGTDMGSGMMGNPTMGGEPMMVGMMGLSGTEMSTMGVRSPNVNMNLPLASAIPINVNENIQNLQQIQSFPVVGIGPNGIHFHQDPVTGQMYRMTTEFHDRIRIINSKTSLFYDAVSNLKGKGIENIFPNTNIISTKENNTYKISDRQLLNDNNLSLISLQSTLSLQNIPYNKVNKYSDINTQTNFKSDTYQSNIPLNVFSDLIPQLDYIQTVYGTNTQVNNYSGI